MPITRSLTNLIIVEVLMTIVEVGCHQVGRLLDVRLQSGGRERAIGAWHRVPGGLLSSELVHQKRDVLEVPATCGTIEIRIIYLNNIRFVFNPVKELTWCVVKIMCMSLHEQTMY